MQMRDPQGRCGCHRRAVLGGSLALAPLLVGAAKADDPTEALPQPGDHLVFLAGPKRGKIVRTGDLPSGRPQVQAYPMDPNGVVRDGSRLNLVILARVPPEEVAPAILARSADGVLAYSGVCTHQGCPVNMWSEERSAFVCSCHGSVYDPKDGALLDGPAPRGLAALPLKSDNGVLVVAATFIGDVGVIPE